MSKIVDMLRIDINVEFQRNFLGYLPFKQDMGDF